MDRTRQRRPLFSMSTTDSMEDFDPASPGICTLDVFEETTYAYTSTKTMHAIRFFLEDLKAVKVEDLDPEDRKCHICTEEFTADSHIAVRLPCNHHFGEPCIQLWLRPYGKPRVINRESYPGANSCPMCRRVFFPEHTDYEDLAGMEMRIKLWDMAYARVGIALSERDRQAREDLLLFLQKYRARGFDEYYPDISETPTPHIMWAQFDLLRFCRNLEEKNLGPLQEVLRAKLMWVASPDPGSGPRWDKDSEGQLFTVRELGVLLEDVETDSD